MSTLTFVLAMLAALTIGVLILLGQEWLDRRDGWWRR